MTYDEWHESDQRDRNPLIIDQSPRIWYDRFIKVFVVVDKQKIVPVEALIDIARR